MTEFASKLIRVANMNTATQNLIDEKGACALEALCTHMLSVNKELNLTAIRDEDGVILKHFVDSVAIIPYIKDGASMCDVGCGGGFPSLPVAILRPDVSVLGLDSVTKKVEYVKSTAALLGLDNVRVSNERAEALGRSEEWRESFDVVSARGVGRLSLICELCLPLLRVGGVFIAMKSLTAKDELDEAKNAISILGGKLEKSVDYTITDGTEELSRTIIIIKKQTHTPPKYPRNNSQISKKPL